jgi:hypothetical protein
MALTPEQQAVLDDEVATDPTGKGYAALLPDQPGHVVDLLNALTETMRKERLITNLTLSSVLGVTLARSIRTKLNVFATTDIIIADFVSAMGAQPGSNIGDPETIEMIDYLVTVQDGFTPEEAAALKLMSLQSTSRAEALGLPRITEAMLRGE